MKSGLRDERGAGVMLVALIILGLSLMVGTFIISGKWLLDEAAYQDTQARLRNTAYAISSTKFQNLNLPYVRHYETDVSSLPTTIQELVSRSGAVAACDINTSAGVRDARGWCGPYVAYMHSGESLVDGWGRAFVIHTNNRTIRSNGPNMIDNTGAGDDIVREY